MKKRLGYTTSAFVAVMLAVFSLVACSSSDNPTEAEQSQIQAENEPSSSATDLPESSEMTTPESTESAEPTSAGSYETTTPESSESTSPESAETTTPESSDSTTPESAESTTSSASALTPLQQYEQSQPFIDDGWRDECLKLANEYRASEGVAPLVLADDDTQYCTIQQAAADMEENKAHGHSSMCGIGAQNSGPNFSTTWRTSATAAVQYYIKRMWEDEKALVTSGERDPDKSEDYQYIGHYLNMRNSAYTKLSCGIAISEDGTKGWFNMNFYW